MNITIPYKYKPRWYQEPFFDCLANGYKRAVAVWHRRAGKDKNFINMVTKEALKRKGAYYYLFPQHNQARKAIWKGMDRDGFPFMSHVPTEIIVRKSEQEMSIELINGSIIQLIGTDKIDTLMSTNPVGIVFSEYSLQNPDAWTFMRPILRENNGWAIFNFTPRGHNHGYDLYRMAKSNNRWFCELYTACEHPIFNPGGEIPHTDILTAKDIDEEVEDGMSHEKVKQEFFCDFDVSAGNILIPIQSIESAYGRVISFHHQPRIFGGDIGLSKGGDASAWVIRQGGKIIAAKEFWTEDPIRVMGEFCKVWNEYGCSQGYLDAIFEGRSIAAMMQDRGFPVVPVNVAESASEKEDYINLKAELYFKGRKFFQDKMCTMEDTPIMRKLGVEASGPEYEETVAGKMQIESKKSMEKRGIKSPNLFDAFILTLMSTTATAEVYPHQTEVTGINLEFYEEPEGCLL